MTSSRPDKLDYVDWQKQLHCVLLYVGVLEFEDYWTDRIGVQESININFLLLALCERLEMINIALDLIRSRVQNFQAKIAKILCAIVGQEQGYGDVVGVLDLSNHSYFNVELLVQQLLLLET